MVEIEEKREYKMEGRLLGGIEKEREKHYRVKNSICNQSLSEKKKNQIALCESH